MAKYMFLLFDDESWYDAPPEDWQQAMEAHGAFMKAIEAAGAEIVSSEALQRSTTATLVSNGGDKHLVTDGPFIETKEALGGYYLIEARDLDQALELAKQCPSANVEVRACMVFDQG